MSNIKRLKYCFQEVCEDVPEEVCETVMEQSCRTVQEEVCSDPEDPEPKEECNIVMEEECGWTQPFSYTDKLNIKNTHLEYPKIAEFLNA